jgi:hypothetical protein
MFLNPSKLLKEAVSLIILMLLRQRAKIERLREKETAISRKGAKAQRKTPRKHSRQVITQPLCTFLALRLCAFAGNLLSMILWNWTATHGVKAICRQQKAQRRKRGFALTGCAAINRMRLAVRLPFSGIAPLCKEFACEPSQNYHHYARVNPEPVAVRALLFLSLHPAA